MVEKNLSKKQPSNDDEDESKDVSPMTLQAKLAVMALFIMGFLDTLGYMALMPTLIFYVRAVGGDESQYGSIMAANNFSAFLMMPLYASYVDATGKFRKVFFLGTFLCILGQVFYTFAKYRCRSSVDKNIGTSVRSGR